MFEQLRELRDRYGFEVVAVVSGPQGKLIDKLKSENIPFHVANFTDGPGTIATVLGMPLAVLQRARFFRREQVDVVQSHIFISMRTARPAAWLAGVPVRIAMIAGPYHLQAYTSRWMELSTSWMETMLLPSCEFSADLCRKMEIPEKRVGPVIYYGPDERNFNPDVIPPADIRAEFGWPADTPLICMVAYFYHRLPVSRWVPSAVHGRGVKGHGDLVKAAPIVLRAFPNAKFLLVGAGWGPGGENYLEDTRELVRSLGLEESIIFLGFRADANRILRAANVAVQPSLNENLGGTVEALLMQCPTVATRVGGIPESVRDRETGILVNPSDPEDLARGIIELLSNPRQAETLGRAGRKLMLSAFTLAHTADDLATLYHRLLSAAEHKRKSHNPFVLAFRLGIAAPLFVYIASRFLIFDLALSVYLPLLIKRLFRLPGWLARRARAE